MTCSVSNDLATAIGYSTNLISRQSNLIVVRGSGKKTPYEQLVSAAERFFPQSGIMDHDGVHPHHPDEAFERMDGRRDDRLRRANTGLDSLVGADNGQRAGGFVLVIDGHALELVRYLVRCYDRVISDASCVPPGV